MYLPRPNQKNRDSATSRAGLLARCAMIALTRSAAIRRRRFITEPVPAGIRKFPTITFSFRPSSVSSLPLTAASVRTRVVSWNEAAEIKLLVCNDAFVMPSRTRASRKLGAILQPPNALLASANSSRSTCSPTRKVLSAASSTSTFCNI